MATDLYVPTEKHPEPFDIGTSRVTHGTGSPEGVVSGTAGDLYVDDATGTLYGKTGTGTTGWVAGAGGGSGSVLADDYGGIEPNVTPTGPAWAKDTSTGELWFFDGSTWSDTGMAIP